MTQSAPPLRWGDIVRIHGVNLSKKDEDKTRGLIVSKGFTDPNIYYQKYEKFEEINLYRQSLFQLLPRSNFDIHDQLQQDNLIPQQKQLLKSRAISEVTALQASLQAKAGKQIKYGAEVIFRHVESQSYLRGILKAADTGEGAFKIEVTESLSSQLIFKITSHRSYEHDNDQIYYDDALLIYHPSADCFMNFADKDEPIHLDTDYNIKESMNNPKFEKYAAERPAIKRPVQNRIPIINENKSKCLWKFINHCSFEEFNSKNKIKSHDIVYFQHTKQGGLVSSTLAKPILYYLKESGKGLYYECFWELIPKQVNEFGPEKCGAFWARNIVTGQLLTYNDFNVEIQSQNPDGGSSKNVGFDNQGLINLICSDASEGKPLKLERDSFIPLSEDIPRIVSYFESQYQKISFKAVPKLPKDIFMIYKVDEKTLLDIQFALSSHEPFVKFVEIFTSYVNKSEGDPESLFKMFYPTEIPLSIEDSFANIVVILKMLIGKIYGTSYEQIISCGNLPDPNMQKILVETGIVQLVIEIIHLLYEPFLYMESTDAKEDRAVRNKLSEIFEYCYRLLQKVAANNEENRQYISRWVDLFLEHSNHINRSYIQECLVGILHNNPVSIEATINEDKIKTLIDSFFNEAKRQAPDAPLTTKYLKLFSTFIVCEDRVIRENQNIILTKFFMEQKNEEQSFRFKVEYKSQFDEEGTDIIAKIKSREVLIAFGKQQFSTISKFFRDWRSKWNYFIGYVNLLADICLDRNNEAIKNVSALLSLQIVTTILFDPEMSKLNNQIYEENKKSILETGEPIFPIANIHEPFARIAHHLYVNNENFSPIKRIKKISRWYRHEEIEAPYIEDINKTKRAFEGQKEQQQEKYLKSILIFMKEFLKKADQDPAKLSMLYTVLDLLKTTVSLGLWSYIEEFRVLIPDLIMKVTKIGKDKFFSADEELSQRKTLPEIVQINKNFLKMNRPQISKSIECKIKATKIFEQINQLEIDIRLRYIMNFFKGLYETTEDFHVYDIPISDKIDENCSELDSERNKKAKQEYTKGDGKSILGDQIKKMSEDQEIILKQNMWYNKLMEMAPFHYEPTSDKIKNRYLFQGGLSLQDLQKTPGEEIPAKMNLHFNNIILSLLQLPIYHDYKLLNSSLVMLRSIFEQRKGLIQNFKAILICGKGNLLDVYKILKFMRGKFETLNNMNILKYQGDFDPNFSYALWKPYDTNHKAEDKKSGIIQDLFFLSRTLKNNIELKNIDSLMRVNEDAFATENVYSYLDEREKNNSLFQSVNIAEGIYIPLLKYIQIVGDNDFGQIHFKLLRSIYQYLTLLCFNNLESKQIMIKYIPDILPHLKKKVGASVFLYTVCRDNKLLISNEELIVQIIEAALDVCVQMELKLVFENLLSHINKASPITDLRDYEKSSIFYALRGILLFHDEGHKRNQELLMNKLQDSKYRRLIFQNPLEYRSKLDNFDLNPDESFVASHFEMFAGLVESGNMINIGKLENIHSYIYCLDCLKNTNRWQIRRAIRMYVNRLYYVNKDKDIFLFEEFIRKEFDIINVELGDLVELHKSKVLKEDIVIKNGIRFRYALSEIMLTIIEILISLHQILLKSEFVKVLRRQLIKEEKYGDSSRPLHEKLIKLYKNIGCLKKLYPQTKTVSPFIREVTNLLKGVLMKLQSKYLQKKSEPEGFEAQVKGEIDEIGAQTEKRAYVYDHSKSFFRNLTNMIRDLKSTENINKLKKQYYEKKQKGEQPGEEEEDEEVQINPEEKAKLKYLKNIYLVPSVKLKPMHIRKSKAAPSYYNPHLQTTTSTTFKVLAKPTISENKQNIQLNERLGLVKKMMDESPVFHKFLDDQFILFVKTLTNIDNSAMNYYAQQWSAAREALKPVVPLHQMLKIIFSMIVNKPAIVKDSEKIFILKMVRCYITEAVEGKQDYKLSVDKWDADYCKEDQGEDGEQKQELAKRQEEMEKCGGSDFLISILSEDLTNRIDLLNEALLLGIAYLFKGNKICQNSILASLTADRDNLMLLNIRKIIKRIGDFLIDIRTIKEGEKKRKFNYNIVDTYDYFSVEDQEIVRHFGHSKVDKFEQQIEANNELAMCRLFRFLQLFCENNNIEMKKFLYAQTNQDSSKKTNSANFIEEACLLLRKFFKIMNSKIVNVPDFLLSFIGEITQLPCLDNQISLMKSTFFEDISYLATFFEDDQNRKKRQFNLSPEGDDDPLNSLLGIYEQGVQMALSNFEGNDPVIMSEFLNKCNPRYLWVVMRNSVWSLLTSEKYIQMDIHVTENDLDKDNCRMTLEKFFGQRIDEVINNERKEGQCFDGQLIMILNIVTIIKKIQDYGSDLKAQAIATEDKENPNVELHEEIKRAQGLRNAFYEIAKEEYPKIDDFFTRMEDLLIKIAVSSFNGQKNTIQNIYFPQHAIFKYLSKQTRVKIMMDVQRDTRRDKLISLTNSREQIYSEIVWNYTLNYNKISLLGIQKEFPITSEACKHVRDQARNLSFLICGLLLIFITVDHDQQNQQSTFVVYGYLINLLIRILCFGQLALTLVYCYLWGKMRGRLALQAYYKEEEEDEGIQIPELEQAEVKKSEEGWITLQEQFMIYWSYFTSFLSKIKNLLTKNFIYTWCIEPVIAIQKNQSGFLSLALFVIASLLGNFYGVEWFTIHMFDVFVSIPLLANVFKAILNNFQILTILSLLATAFILVFNVLSFSTYSSVIYEEDIPEESCETILDCILQLYTSGAIGDDMDSLVVGRFIFDIIYVVFMELLFQSLVGGIMIDAFSELSQNDNNRDEDQSGFCYICSMSKPNIQKTGVTFKEHIKNHRLWHYAFYIYVLENKDPTDYTGIEYVIMNQLKSEEVGWFPDLGEGSTDGQTEELMAGLEQKLMGMKERTQNLLNKGKEALKEGTDILPSQEEQKMMN